MSCFQLWTVTMAGLSLTHICVASGDYSGRPNAPSISLSRPLFLLPSHPLMFLSAEANISGQMVALCGEWKAVSPASPRSGFGAPRVAAGGHVLEMVAFRSDSSSRAKEDSGVRLGLGLSPLMSPLMATLFHAAVKSATTKNRTGTHSRIN